MAAAKRKGDSAITWWILVKELRDLMRDRRALMFAFVLPLLLYPLLFLLVTYFSNQNGNDLGDREIRIGVRGDRHRVVELLADQNLVIEEGEPQAEAVRTGELDLVFEVNAVEPSDAVGPEPPTGPDLTLTVYYLTTSQKSIEGLRRVKEVLTSLERKEIQARLDAWGVDVELESLVPVVDLDVATLQERSAAGMARFLPLVLVLVLLTGGSFAALDLVAGEKERGTLETLYLHPVQIQSVVIGKFFVIFFASTMSVALNLLGIVIAMGIGSVFDISPPQLRDVPFVFPSVWSLLNALSLVVPLALLTSAILLVVSAYARSFREAQLYLFPLTVLALLAVLPAMSPLGAVERGGSSSSPSPEWRSPVREILGRKHAVVGPASWRLGRRRFTRRSAYALRPPCCGERISCWRWRRRRWGG